MKLKMYDVFVKTKKWKNKKTINSKALFFKCCLVNSSNTNVKKYIFKNVNRKQMFILYI